MESGLSLLLLSIIDAPADVHPIRLEEIRVHRRGTGAYLLSGVDNLGPVIGGKDQRTTVLAPEIVNTAGQGGERIELVLAA